MRIIFIGTSDFGAPCLTTLVRECFDIPCVVTQPDHKCGRGLKAASCAIKTAALSLGLKIFQPENINDPASSEYLVSLKPDLFVVISYGQILSTKVLDIPALMAVNIHGSLLPKYRGPSPIRQALINGDRVTGNTLMKLVRRMDAGPVILAREEEILPEDDAVTLERKLSAAAPALLLEGIGLIAAGKAPLREQDESLASYAPKLVKSDGLIDWTRDCGRIRDRIRGLAGWPGSYTLYKRRLLKIFPPVKTGEGSAAPGTVLAASCDGLTVACGTGSLLIEEVQPEGKRKMSFREFCAGHAIKPGDRLGA